MLILVFTLLVAYTAAVLQPPPFDDLNEILGDKELNYVIHNHVGYKVNWQHCHGDPHVRIGPTYNHPESLCLEFGSPELDSEKILLFKEKSGIRVEAVLKTVRTGRNIIAELRFYSPTYSYVFNVAGVTFPNNTIRHWSDVIVDHTIHVGSTLNLQNRKAELDMINNYRYIIQTFGAMSIDVFPGDSDYEFDGLIGQLHSYNLFLPENVSEGTSALGFVNGDKDYPFMATKIFHPDMNGTCWNILDRPLTDRILHTENFILLSPP